MEIELLLLEPEPTRDNGACRQRISLLRHHTGPDALFFNLCDLEWDSVVESHLSVGFIDTRCPTMVDEAPGTPNLSCSPLNDPRKMSEIPSFLGSPGA